MGRLRQDTAGISEEQPGIASFSDIAFLLIIYFVLATTLMRTQGFEAEIPAGSESQQQEQNNERLTVQLKDNRIFLNETTPVSFEVMLDRLVAMELSQRATDEDRIIVLTAAGEVRYELQYRVMAAITEAGGIIGMVDRGGQ